MATHAPIFPENRFAENRSPDPNDGKNKSGQSSDVNHERRQRESDVEKKPRRFSRQDVEKNLPPDPDPDDPVSP